MLYDIGRGGWSDELCALFDVPRACLPEVLPSSGRFGLTVPEHAAGLHVPVSGIAGDQQAALFGQACVEPGMTKNTYGTGSFVLTNVGPKLPEPVEGLLTTVAWSLAPGDVTYAMEGAIFVTGAAIQWMRDGLGIIGDAAETGPLAASVPDAGGIYVVPAFTGLGSPWWDPYARGTVVGITRGTNRAHLARAIVEAMAFQTVDVVEAITRASGTALSEMRVDGGASVMDVLCQFQADVLDVPVRRAAIQETTALGAAFLAGVAEGVWASAEEVNAQWSADASFAPAMSEDDRARRLAEWRRAVERSRDWARE
jgi:glycerol kinase